VGKTRAFSQHELRQRLPRSFGAYGEGVCRSLVSAWLKTQGRMRRTSFGSASTTVDWIAIDDRVMEDMSRDRGDMLSSHGLMAYQKRTFQMTEFGELTKLLGSGGGYYIALKDTITGAGHALGVYVLDGKWRLFDPNEATFSGEPLEVVNKLFALLKAYALGTPAPQGPDGQPAWRLQQWEVEAVI
jgi:hypothetical protein